MKFDFFTFGGRFFWEDIYNYQDWVIQRNIMNQKCRLLDSHNIRRHSGTFEQCKETLLKYIEAYELDPLYDDTIVILHGFGRSKKSIKPLADALKELPANVIALGYPSLRRDIFYHATMLSQFLQNLDINGRLFIINVGSSCLITRKLLSKSRNYRQYNIARILDINPLNSGSDLAELLAGKKFFNFVLGPMLHDISTPKAVSLAHIPHDIDHAIIFSPLTVHDIVRKALARFDSFPFSTPPSEESYADNVKTISKNSFFPLSNPELFKYCKNYISNGKFYTPKTGGNKKKDGETASKFQNPKSPK
ncbi:MAG: hypothetical protein IKN71_01680 [Alphaproteobacteria bacterium]|nr:hypothetical protein [Alphaproteobacteria bacterium]